MELGSQTFSSVLRCMYIPNAKSKLPIVRKRKATHAIVMAIVNWKQYRRRSSCNSVQDYRGFFLRPLTTTKGKEQRVYHPSSARVPCFYYTYIRTQKVALREGAIDAGVTPRRATMPTCTDARMRRVLHGFFTPVHTYTYTHACTYTRVYNPHTSVYAHTVSDLPSVHRGVSLLWPEGRILYHDRKAHVWYFRVLMYEECYNMYDVWGMLHKTHRFFLHEIFKEIYNILCVHIIHIY